MQAVTRPKTTPGADPNAPDPELLRRYVHDGAEDAFSELVRRHVDLVYSVALRQVAGDVQLAEDVTQVVFTALARKGRRLTNRPTLTGWLYRSTHFAASDVVRAERRRRAREHTAQAVHEITIESPREMEWEKLRPAIDAAIAELGARDRDAVSLRYFDGCTFAEIGHRLELTENAARMRVDRALAKLHVALGRRSLASTAAAIAIALTGQANVPAPAMLASALTKVAMAAAAGAAAGTTADAGLAFLAAHKFAALATSIAVLAAVTTVVQYQRAETAERHLATVEQQRAALEARIDQLATQMAQAERRATDAEKDSSDLLKAVADLRAQQASPAVSSALAAAAAARADEDERLEFERAYQQELARTRAEAAKVRAQIDERLAKLDPAGRYHYLLQVARRYAEAAEFQLGIRAFNEAVASKPSDVPTTDDVKELRATLLAQNEPVNVTLVSDGQTWVSIANYRAPAQFTSIDVKILPGNYEVRGRRKGATDVVLRLEIRSGVKFPPISVVCPPGR